MCKRLRSLIYLAVALGGCQGLTDPGVPKPIAALEGRALYQLDEPAADADIYLTPAGGAALHVGRTASDGRFSLAETPTGPVTLILNDRRGAGALRQMILYAGGQNTVGDMILDRLDRFPQIVETSGVGFEERVSKSTSENLYPRLDSTGTFAYVVQYTESRLYQVVRIDTATGEETVVFDQVPGGSGSTPSPERYPITTLPTGFHLVADRFLLLEGTRPGHIYDLVSKEFVLNLNMLPEKTWTDGKYLFTVSYSVTSDSPVYKMYFVARVDLQTLAYSQMYLSLCYTQSIDFFEHSDTTLYFVTHPEPGQDTPSYCRSINYSRMDLTGTWSAQEATPLTGGFSRIGSIAGDPQALYFTGLGPEANATTLKRMNADGTVSDVARFSADPANETSPFNLVSSPFAWARGRNELLVGGLLSQGAGFGFARVSLGSGAVSAVPTEYDYQGNRRWICSQYNYFPCTVELDVDGMVHVGEIGGRSSQGDVEAVYVSMDVDANNQIVRRRRVPVLASTAEANPAPKLHINHDRTRDAVALRDPDSGFEQIFVGDMTTDGQMAAATWLRSDHGPMAFSADGKTLFYFVRDPLSGFEQLFRIAVK